MTLPLPFLSCALMTAISALVSLGFAVAAIRSSVGEARVSALYAGARSVALVVVSLVAFALPRPWLEAAAVGMIVVQALDALIGVVIKSTLKTFGPAATATFNLAALVWMARS